MGGAASTSDASSHQSTTTTTYSDSFNTTTNRVLNLSDVGNVNVTYPGAETAGATIGSFLPMVAIGVAGIVALALFRSR